MPHRRRNYKYQDTVLRLEEWGRVTKRYRYLDCPTDYTSPSGALIKRPSTAWNDNESAALQVECIVFDLWAAGKKQMFWALWTDYVVQPFGSGSYTLACQKYWAKKTDKSPFSYDKARIAGIEYVDKRI